MSTAGHLAPLLRLSDDVLLDICDAVKVGKPVGDGTNKSDMTSLKALSQCNRRFRRILFPEVLRSVSIYCPGSWSNANEQLQGLLSCEWVKYHTRRFGLDLRDSQVEDYSTPDTMTMPAWFRQDLGELLRGMVKLEHLTLHVMEELWTDPAWRINLGASISALPTVRTLVLDSAMDYVVRCCPNVKSVIAESSSSCRRRTRWQDAEFIKACGSADQLRHFELYSRWSKEMLEQVLNAMPQLSSLAMTGIYYRHDLAMLIPILSRFEHLETLALASARHLWIGFNPSWSWGGCKHRLRSSPRIRERVDEERREAHYKAARMCFGACKALEVLWIGDGTKATVVRDADGGVAVVDVVEGLQRPPVA